MGKLVVERKGDWVHFIELHELGATSGVARISIAELPRLVQDMQAIYMPQMPKKSELESTHLIEKAMHRIEKIEAELSEMRSTDVSQLAHQIIRMINAR